MVCANSRYRVKTAMSTSRRIKRSEVKKITLQLLKQQNEKCVLCMQPIPPGMACLDHDHSTGEIRSVLCKNCNGMEGKIFNRANRAKRSMTVIEWTERLIKYWKYHSTPRHNLLHWTFKTAEEKRLETNAKARKRRALKKAKENLKKR